MHSLLCALFTGGFCLPKPGRIRAPASIRNLSNTTTTFSLTIPFINIWGAYSLFLLLDMLVVDSKAFTLCVPRQSAQRNAILFRPESIFACMARKRCGFLLCPRVFLCYLFVGVSSKKKSRLETSSEIHEFLLFQSSKLFSFSSEREADSTSQIPSLPDLWQ